MSVPTSSHLMPRESTSRLEHVDAMRPFAQGAVIGTHALIFFAPFAKSQTVVGVLLVTRFSRDAFFFISALVLTYTYLEPASMHLAQFWRRRLRTTVLPYVAWTVIYYVFISAQKTSWFPYYRPSPRYLVSLSGLHDFVTLLFTGYYQLYFIVVLVQFYVVFPWMLRALRRYRRTHLPLVGAAALWQIFYDESIRSHFLFASVGGKLETRLLVTYPLYVLGGMIAGLHYRAFHAWCVGHSRVILTLTLSGATVAIVLDSLRDVAFIEKYIAPGSDVLSPVANLYDVGAILSLYVLGVILVDRRRPSFIRRSVASTADASLGIYLSQMLWIPILLRAATTTHLYGRVAWELKVPVVLVAVFLLGYLVTALLERTPLSSYVLGRPQKSRRLPRAPRWG